jgi:hypothetical protein
MGGIGAAAKANASAARVARARLSAALALFASCALIGGPWDMLWHMSVPFESFFSPPHLFIYGMTGAAMLVVLSIALKPELRAAFGRSSKVPGLRVEVPPCLVILGGGLLVLLLSGVIDEMWHAAFGIDETRFSAPHAMFGWGLFVTALGFASARLALKDGAPISTAEAVLYGFLLLAFSLYAFLLPYLVYATEGTLQAISALPVIQAQPSAAHTFRIYEAWSVHRGSPAFAPLACLWGGVAMELVRAVDRRPRTALVTAGAAAALYTALWYGFAVRLGTQGDLRTWLPLPVFPALAAVILAQRASWEPMRAQALGGVVFASLSLLVWSQAFVDSGGLVFGAALAACVAVFVLGARAGRALIEGIRSPRSSRAMLMVFALGILIPLAFGALDLQVRLATP